MKFLRIVMFAALALLSASVFAQQASKSKQKASKVLYSCPMHLEETSKKPGTCSKCGMDLERIKKAKTKTYVCPMHSEITSSKPGSCSICHMDLTEKKN